MPRATDVSRELGASTGILSVRVARKWWLDICPENNLCEGRASPMHRTRGNADVVRRWHAAVCRFTHRMKQQALLITSDQNAQYKEQTLYYAAVEVAAAAG